MAEPRRARWRAVGATSLSIGGAYALGAALVRVRRPIARALWANLEPGVREIVDFLFWRMSDYLGPAFALALFAATIVAPLAFVARLVARAHIRSGQADPFERARRWTSAHPRWTRALLAAPALAWATYFAVHFHHRHPFGIVPSVVLPGTLAGYVHFCLARFGLHALLAPVFDEGELSPREVTSSEIRFDAVAVTRETRAAVGAVAALSTGMAILACVLPVGALVHDGRFFAAVTAYLVVVLAGTALFRRASRIAIGLDGVLVYGTSRTRFFAYRDLHEARTRAGDIELLGSGGSVVLRLQLHGPDAARRGAILERLQESVRGAREGKQDATTEYVASASREDLVRVAEGAGDYRQAAVSREQLWAAVLGPAIESTSRRAAAEALAHSSNAEERTRLRVAAEHCADPSVRIALQELGERLEEETAEEPRETAARS